MKNVQITDLRGNLRRAIEEVAETREPLAIRRRDETLAVLVPPPRSGQVKPDIPLSVLDEFMVQHRLKGFYLFGSVLTEHFHAGSDVDVMIDTGARMPSYFETCRMTEELEVLFGRSVDVIIKSTIERDKNSHRRAAILGTARLILERDLS